MDQNNENKRLLEPINSLEGNSSEGILNESINNKNQSLKRWYVLLVFSLASAMQSCIWGSWAPISSSSEKAYNFTKSEISLLTNYGPIMYIISTPPLMLLMHKSLNYSIVLLSFTITFSMALRCVPFKMKYLIHAAQILNGAVGPIAMAASPLVSAMWFRESSLATAISACSNAFGVAIAFFGPFIVDDPTVTLISVEKLRNQIMIINYSLGCFSFLIFIASVFLPKEPTNIHIPQTFKKDIRLLLPNKGYWLLVIPYSISQGIYGIWSSVIDLIVQPLMNEKQAGWMGFGGSLAGQVLAIFFAKMNDIFKISRQLMIIFYVTSSISLLLFNLNYLYFHNLILLYITYIINIIVSGCSVPIWYVIFCVPSIRQSSSAGLATLLCNGVGLIFLGLLSISKLGVSWANWAILTSSIICLPSLFLYKIPNVDNAIHEIEQPIVL